MQAIAYSKLKILKRLQGSFIKFFFKDAHQVSYPPSNIKIKLKGRIYVSRSKA